MSDPNQKFMTTLHRLLTSYFDREELRTLCFDLGIHYDDLRGEGRASKARELVMLMARRERMPELIELAQKHRPGGNWPSMPEPFVWDDQPEPTSPPPPIKPKHFEPETVHIPAGTFLMGSPAEDDTPEFETPQHEVYLDAFRIGLYPVTNAQFAEFVWKTDRVAAKELLWDGNQPPQDQGKHPVTGVTCYEALAYCQWLSEQTGRAYTLPNEAQWEKAARGVDGRRYPWGDTWDATRCHTGPGSFAAVHACAAQSPYGCYDMVGNAREWTRTLWGVSPREPDQRYAYPWSDDARNDLSAPSTTRRVVRGGRDSKLARYGCAVRHSCFPDRAGPRRNRHGFRVVLALT